MAFNKHSVYRTLFLLEDYYEQLVDNSETKLSAVAASFISLFKSRLFQALLDIQEYYVLTVCKQQGELMSNGSAEGFADNSRDLCASPRPCVWLSKKPINYDKHTPHQMAVPPSSATTFDNSIEVSSNTNSVPKSNHIHRPSPEVNGMNTWEYDTVTLHRSKQGFGFSIAGGYNSPHVDEDPAIYVTKLIGGGVAAQSERVRLGDIICRVNDVDVSNVTHEQAVDALKSTGASVHLTLKRARGGERQVRDTIELVKGNRGLGFSISGGVGNQHIPGDNGIFVTKIMDGGSAHLDGRLAVGDRLVAVNTGQGDQLLENTTHEESVAILKCVVDRVILTVIKSRSTQDPVTQHVPAASSQPVVPTRTSLCDVTDTRTPSPLPLGTSSPYNDTSSLVRSSAATQNSANSDVRTVVLKKRNGSLGFNIVGDTESQGIFVSFILAGGVADCSGQLARGDKLLSVNGVDLRHAQHEQAVTALKSASSTVCLLVQHCPREYGHFESRVSELRHQMSAAPGGGVGLAGGGTSAASLVGSGTLRTTQKRSLYVRTLFDYDPKQDDGLPSRGLGFTFGDILHVTNASDDQWWQAKRLYSQAAVSSTVVDGAICGQSAAPGAGTGYGQIGIIPSRQRWERKLKSRGKCVAFHRTSSQTLSLDRKKRNFSFTRKFPFMKSKEDIKSYEGDENEASTETPTNTEENSPSFSEDPILTYEPVKQINVTYCRPVIVMGPLKDRINDDLISQYPDDFASCIPHTTRECRENEVQARDYYFVSRAQMESDIQNHMFIEAGQYNMNLYGTSVSSVRDVAEIQKKHCILDVTGNAIKRLHSVSLYPIVIYIKIRSLAQIMEWNKRYTEEQALKTLEKSQKLESEFGEYFTAVVSADTPELVYEKVKNVIRQQGTNQIWVPSNERI